MNILLFVTLHTLLFTPWFLFLSKSRLNCRLSERLIASMVAFLTQIITTAQLFGALGMLTPRLLLLSNLVISALVLIYSVFSSRVPPLISSTRGDTTDRPSADVLITIYNGTLFFLLGIFLALALGKGFLFGESTTDGLWYHLALVFFSAQNSGFDLVGNLLVDHYPRNIELWQLWNFFFFGLDFAVSLNQLPFLCLMVLGVYALARRVKVGYQTAIFVSLLSAFSPVILAHLPTTLVDISLSALLVVCLVLMQLVHDRANFLTLSLFGAALGLLLGVKLSGPLFVGAVLGLYLVHSLVINQSRQLPGRLVYLSSISLIVGGYIYIRNALLTGNPVYPYRFNLGPISFNAPLDKSEVFGDDFASSLGTLDRLWRSWSAVGEVGYGYPIGGFGYLWPFLLIFVLSAPFLLLKTKRSPLLIYWVFFALLFLATPLNFTVRFTIFLLPFGAIALGIVLDSLRRESQLRTIVFSAGVLVAVATVSQGVKAWNLETKRLGVGHLGACSKIASPDLYHQAFNWIGNHVKAGDHLVAFIENEWNFSLACLWAPHISNQVSLAKSTDISEFLKKEKSDQGKTYAFLPKSKGVAESVRSRLASATPLFENENAVIVEVEN